MSETQSAGASKDVFATLRWTSEEYIDERNGRLLEALSLDRQQLECQLRRFDISEEVYADLAAAAVLHGEVDDDSAKWFERMRPNITRYLVEGHKYYKDGYLFEVCQPAVLSGSPTLTDLILVSRSAQTTGRVRPYRPGMYTNYALNSEQDFDDSAVDFFALDEKIKALQQALTEYGRVKNLDFTQYTTTARMEAQVVPVFFNVDAPYLHLLVQSDILRGLGWYDHLDPRRGDVVRDAQFSRLLQLGAGARNRATGSWSRMPQGEIEAITAFLSDRQQCDAGNTALAHIPSRLWRFLSGDGRGWRRYREYLDQRKQLVSHHNETYYAMFDADPADLDNQLAQALDTYDVETAGNLWTVATQRQLVSVLKKHLQAVSQLVEPDLIDCAKRLGGDRNLPIYVARLVTDTYLANQLDWEYPTLLTEQYGSIDNDIQTIYLGLSKMLRIKGAEYGHSGASLLALSAAHALYDREYHQWELTQRHHPLVLQDRGVFGGHPTPIQYAIAIARQTYHDVTRRDKTHLKRIFGFLPTNPREFYKRLVADPGRLMPPSRPRIVLHVEQPAAPEYSDLNFAGLRRLARWATKKPIHSGSDRTQQDTAPDTTL